MDVENLIIVLAVGAVAGWLAGILMKGKGFGLIINIIVGVIGAFVGNYIFGLLGVSIAGLPGAIVEAVAGAVTLLFILGILKKV